MVLFKYILLDYYYIYYIYNLYMNIIEFGPLPLFKMYI